MQKLSQKLYPQSENLEADTSILSHKILFSIRVFFAFYFTCSKLHRYATPVQPILFHFLYVTNLAMTLTRLYFVFSVIYHCLFNYFTKTEKLKPMRILSTLFEIVFPIQIILTITYYHSSELIIHETVYELIRDLNVHGFPLIALFIDFVLNSYSFHLPRVFLNTTTCVINYLLIIPYSLTIEPVYKDLPFNNIKSYILNLLSITLCAITYYFLSFVFIFLKRDRVRKMIKQKKFNFNEKNQVRHP